MTQLSTFYVGKYLFGVDVALVQEIVRIRQMTPVPLGSQDIAGLINLRGEVLTAIDMRTRLGLRPSSAETERVNVVIRLDEEPLSLLVDEIGGVFEVSGVPFEQTPSTVDEQVRDLIQGAYTLPDKLLLSLSVEQIIDGVRV
jgi:purine-binding chemotaxis protein CheW